MVPINGTNQSRTIGRVEIAIRGYIQCRKSNWNRWRTWQPTFHFDVAHSGLGSDEDYRTDMERLQAPTSSWFEIYSIGTLGLDNAGRKEKAVLVSECLPLCCFCLRPAASGLWGPWGRDVRLGLSRW